jgi:hypothetical protein
MTYIKIIIFRIGSTTEKNISSQNSSFCKARMWSQNLFITTLSHSMTSSVIHSDEAFIYLYKMKEKNNDVSNNDVAKK